VIDFIFSLAYVIIAFGLLHKHLDKEGAGLYYILSYKILIIFVSYFILAKSLPIIELLIAFILNVIRDKFVYVIGIAIFIIIHKIRIAM
jgi:hypothetical protein